MFDRRTLEDILARVPGLHIGVIGDLFLDRYLEIDPRLTEPSLETGLDAYQVTRVRSQPGAAGTVINNLVALGVGRISPISILGDDGEGYELVRHLQNTPAIDTGPIIRDQERRTPTYIKPLICEPNRLPREINRLDIKNWSSTPEPLQAAVVHRLDALWDSFDAVVVVDQVGNESAAVMTRKVRERLLAHAAAGDSPPVIVDSRERIGMYRHVILKPNARECAAAVGRTDLHLGDAAKALAERNAAVVFCTAGEQGMVVATPDDRRVFRVPAIPVDGPIDIVGAGDSTSAAIACALAAGADSHQAAFFGNLVASITIRQIGTTGVATPAQLLRAWEDLAGEAS